MIGCGTNTCARPGMPLTSATERTTLSNLSVCTATVGTPYFASIVIACAATAGARAARRGARDRLWSAPLVCWAATSPALLLLLRVVVILGSRVANQARFRAGKLLGAPRLHLSN